MRERRAPDPAVDGREHKKTVPTEPGEARWALKKHRGPGEGGGVGPCANTSRVVALPVYIAVTMPMRFFLNINELRGLGNSTSSRNENESRRISSFGGAARLFRAMRPETSGKTR